MHCVNHPGVDRQSFCQSCGKPLCTACIRTTANGQILCEACHAATAADPSQAYWQPIPGPYPVPPPGSPNPSAAAVLGLIPGVGAMYNGQLFKGLIHVVVFAVLVSITDHYPIFGLFIAAWVFYQSFEAFHTAKARRDGLPVPDPFGLNELGSWINLTGSIKSKGYSAPYPPPYTAGTPAAGESVPNPQAASEAQAAPPYSAPYTGGGVYPPTQPPYTDPYAGQYQAQYPGQYAGQYPGPYPPDQYPPIPPIPPDPSVANSWRRREPIGAIVLIGLGVLFLLHSLGVVGDIFRYAFPVLLIGLGAWLVVRRMGYLQGGSK